LELVVNYLIGSKLPNPKELPERIEFGGQYKEWQTLEQQIERIKEKGCECLISE